MTVNQIYDVLNNVCKQTNGEIELTTFDQSGLVALGDTVLSSASTKDVFVNTLTDVITKTVLSNKPYQIDDLILVDYFAFSATIQKIYVDPMQARENPEYSLVDGESIDQYIVRKPSVKQKIFSNKNTFEIDITIPDDSLSSAFRSPEEMAAFIDSIMQALENTLNIEIENLQTMAINNMIGEITHSGKTAQKRHLLEEYNTIHGSAITKATALTDVEFLKYATSQINMSIDRLNRMSVLFNAEGWHRHTPKVDIKFLVLDQFDSACNTYLQADTYHNELTKLGGNYKTVPYWQAPGLDYSFDNASSINMTTSSGNVVEQSDIIGLIFDKDAIFATYTKENTESARNARGRYVNYFYKFTKMYANDLSENCIVFML